ncbi:MAG: hypothetical protein HFJ84_09815 [Clostridiales bacterium]|jgi:catechol 2,3-dioxygenase-like lactoylglutathione lyase family enzyme|nr:hypothetical protein [Clostridiales bacterium]
MDFKHPLLVVEDLDRAKQFYWEVLGLQVILDFGANVTLTGGICLQTRETWETFLEAVCRRFWESEMSVAETAVRMDVPEHFVRSCMQ